MLSREQNERLTRVGPGTPMGELMRRYWQPFLPGAKLDENPVQRVRLLGEDLVCYRDRSGTLGLVGARCAHRLVDLAFGIPEEHGLRCPYHGWCYDERGTCTETPLESPHSRLASHVSIGGYPVQEMGGLLFAYLGPAPAPILPPWDIYVVPNALRQIGWSVIPCNWLQCQENASDPVHSVYLHGHFFQYILEREGLLEERAPDKSTHRAFASISQAAGFSHVISKVDAHGVQKAMVFTPERGAPAYKEHWHSYMIFPHMVRVGAGGVRYELQIRVPVDDTHTYHLVYDIYAVPDGLDYDVPVQVPCYEIPMTDESGAPTLDFVLAQDLIAWSAQGAIVDRSREHLGATDEAIVRYRAFLEEQLQLVEAGKDPINVFRDPAEIGEMIALSPPIDRGSSASDQPWIGANRQLFHKGYWRDEADRYGPLIDDVRELMRRAAESATAS
jgi:5,5'-dehydrodivanillate O-demethylase oxygenase subunit